MFHYTPTSIWSFSDGSGGGAAGLLLLLGVGRAFVLASLGGWLLRLLKGEG